MSLIREIVCAICEHTGRGEEIYSMIGKPDFLRYANWLRKRGVQIGENTTINKRAIIYCGDEHMIKIGRDCSISMAEFVTHSGGDRPLSELTGLTINSSRGITIGDRCIIGSGVQIGPGVTIGDDCILGFGAVVRKNVPSGLVMVGNPAVVVGTTEAYRAKQVHLARQPVLQEGF